MEALQVKVQKFMASQWKELHESSVMATIREEERFHDTVADAVAKYMTKSCLN